MNEPLTLVYIFLCFSIGLTCLGVMILLASRTGDRLARAFLVFHGALSVLVLSGLLQALPHTFPNAIAPATRAALEYAESIVGSYSVMFALPYFVHRLFGLRDSRRDWWMLAIVSVALIGQHFTEYVIGGAWDPRGDVAENLLFSAIVLYVVVFALRRINAPMPDRALALRVLFLFLLGIPGLAYDLFFAEATAFRAYPLVYCALGLVVTVRLVRRQGAIRAGKADPDWGLSRRETEVLSLVRQGMSNKDIAASLHISPNTVKTHLRALFEKSGAKSRFELISMGASGPGGMRAGRGDEQDALKAENHPTG